MSAVSGVANSSNRLTMAAGRSSWIAVVAVNGRSPSPWLSSSRQSTCRTSGSTNAAISGMAGTPIARRSCMTQPWSGSCSSSDCSWRSGVKSWLRTWDSAANGTPELLVSVIVRS